MLSKIILELIMAESETMIVEWADTKDGYGKDIIETKIDEYLSSQGYNGQKMVMQLKKNVRAFILQDMAIMGW